MLIPKVLEMFEWREAIYQEQGFLRVRVFNLRHKSGSAKLNLKLRRCDSGIGCGAIQICEQTIRREIDPLEQLCIL
jgi:hypothetical protein